MAITKYGDISITTAGWVATEMLNHAEPIIVLQKFGLTKPIPKNKTDTIRFRRVKPFPVDVATLKLQEGVTPQPQDFRYETVSAKLEEYGAFAEITDKIEDIATDPVLSDASIVSGEQAAELTEAVVYGVLRAGTNVFYGGTATKRDDVDKPITLELQRKITKLLKRNRAKFVTRMVGPSVKYGTTALPPSFIAFGHSDIEADLRDIKGFVAAETYGSQVALPFEIGKIEDVRYILSPTLSPITKTTPKSNTPNNVYPIIYIGSNDAYASTALKGAESIEPQVLKPNMPRGSDPLGQRGTVGWKTWFAAERLNELWMARAEVVLT